jgi:hypothetical protein
MKLTLFLLVLTAMSVKAQTATFKYQFENQQSKKGHFSFVCKDSVALNFEADASAGYLGAANNPYMQATANKGPIPNGTWTITSIKNEAKAILRLTPGKDVNIKWRTGFLIHGQGEQETPEESSNGCIVLKKEYRLLLMKAFKKYHKVTVVVTNFTTGNANGNG